MSLHHHIALFWMIGAPTVFAPVIENGKRPDTGAIVAWGVAIVAVMILCTPLLLRWPLFRRWYGWTDALSERQRLALAQSNLRRYYQTAFDDGYVSRVMPYVLRLIWTVGGLMAMTTVLPGSAGQPALDALMLFSIWYPMGVTLLAFASLPLCRMLRARALEGVLSQNRRNFRHPSSSPATSASRSIILPSLWKV